MYVLRIFLGIFAGVVLAIVLLALVEFFSAVVHPFPADFQHTHDAMCVHVARYPHWVLAVCVPMWTGIALACPLLAMRIGCLAAGVTVATILGLMLVANVLMLPYTLWFKIVMLGCLPIASFLGVWLGIANPAQPTLAG